MAKPKKRSELWTQEEVMCTFPCIFYIWGLLTQALALSISHWFIWVGLGVYFLVFMWYRGQLKILVKYARKRK